MLGAALGPPRLPGLQGHLYPQDLSKTTTSNHEQQDLVPLCLCPTLDLPLKVTLSLAFALWEGNCLSPHGSLFLRWLPVRVPSSLAGRCSQAAGHRWHLVLPSLTPHPPKNSPLKAEKWEAARPGHRLGSLLAGRAPPTAEKGSGQPPLSQQEPIQTLLPGSPPQHPWEL